jgi:hypothetical protein
VLNLAVELERWTPGGHLRKLGFRIHRVIQWEQLVAFARAWVRENYEDAGDVSAPG